MDKYILGLSQKHNCDFKRVAEELKQIAGCQDLDLLPDMIEQRYRVLTGQKMFKVPPNLPSSYLSESDDEPEELFIVPSHHLITDYVFDEVHGPVLPGSKQAEEADSDSEEEEKQEPTLQWTTQL